jgi:hypothetical protein
VPFKPSTYDLSMFLKRMNGAGLGNRISSPFHIYKNESIYLAPYIFIIKNGGEFIKRMGPE